MSTRPPPKIPYRDNWMCDLDSYVAGSSKDTQRIQPKTKTQLSSTVRSVCGHESTQRCVLTLNTCWRWSNKYGETRVGGSTRGARNWFQSTRTVACCWERSRTSPSSRACEKTENHLHREAFHADLQLKNVYNPFSKNSKEMIRELGNVELFELCETVPKVQCSHCLPSWNQGIVFCICGQAYWQRIQKKV